MSNPVRAITGSLPPSDISSVQLENDQHLADSDDSQKQRIQVDLHVGSGTGYRLPQFWQATSTPTLLPWRIISPQLGQVNSPGSDAI